MIRSSLLLLALFGTATFALPAPSAHAQQAAEVAPPATVISHTLDVTVDSGGRLRETQTWMVRIDDPAACEAGLQGPPGLSGAMDGDAIVLDDLLIVPSDIEKGTILTLGAGLVRVQT